MSNFHLRPVSDRSASPSTSTSTTSERSPSIHAKRQAALAPLQPSVVQPPTRSRQPWSPSALRDVDLPVKNDPGPRKYPAPPTGHDLMALFPAAPPVNLPPGPTSGYFEREERAFFARAGKEIVRVRIEVDMPQPSEKDDPKHIRRDLHQGQFAPPPPHLHASPHQAPPNPHVPPAPFPAHANATRAPRAVPVPMTTPTPFPPGHPTQPPMGVHAPPDVQHFSYPQHPQHEHAIVNGGKPLELHPAEFREESDESWRRPMPHNERRRAGKHTKRVIVK
ncbi:hypothetical protein BKA93DRAFT_751131 [Sparassis latifolia]